MFRLWAKEFKDNRMLKDMTVCNDKEDTRTHKVFGAIDEVCLAFDLGKPIWLDSNVADCPVTEQLCEAVLSLPMHPYLTKEMIVGVTDSLKKALH